MDAGRFDFAMACFYFYSQFFFSVNAMLDNSAMSECRARAARNSRWSVHFNSSCVTARRDNLLL